MGIYFIWKEKRNVVHVTAATSAPDMMKISVRKWSERCFYPAGRFFRALLRANSTRHAAAVKIKPVTFWLHNNLFKPWSTVTLCLCTKARNKLFFLFDYSSAAFRSKLWKHEIPILHFGEWIILNINICFLSLSRTTHFPPINCWVILLFSDLCFQGFFSDFKDVFLMKFRDWESTCFSKNNTWQIQTNSGEIIFRLLLNQHKHSITLVR